MIVKSTLFSFAIMITVISCTAYKQFKFTSYEIDYGLNVPKNYQLKKIVGEEGYREHQAVYMDSSVIYITNEYESGVSIKAKEEKYGANVYIKILVSDTLTLDGRHNDGKYWKEYKQGKVVVGYFNVPPDKKKEYDKALATLRRKK